MNTQEKEIQEEAAELYPDDIRQGGNPYRREGYIAAATAKEAIIEDLQLRLEAQDANVEILLDQIHELKNQLLAAEIINNGLGEENERLKGLQSVLDENGNDYRGSEAFGYDVKCAVLNAVNSYIGSEHISFTEYFLRPELRKVGATIIYESFVTWANKCNKNLRDLKALHVQQLSDDLFEIQFGPDLLCQVKVVPSGIEVVNAMNGWGNAIPADQVQISKITP